MYRDECPSVTSFITDTNPNTISSVQPAHRISWKCIFWVEVYCRYTAWVVQTTSSAKPLEAGPVVGQASAYSLCPLQKVLDSRCHFCRSVPGLMYRNGLSLGYRCQEWVLSPVQLSGYGWDDRNACCLAMHSLLSSQREGLPYLREDWQPGP